MRALGVSDLVLVPGLLWGRPRWPWMVGRAALNLAQAAYLHGVAPQSSSPQLAKGGAGVLVAPDRGGRRDRARAAARRVLANDPELRAARPLTLPAPSRARITKR